MIQSSSPLSSPAPQKTKTWVIVVVVIVVLCCLCFGAIGLLIAFGLPVLNELGLYALLPILAALP